MEQKLELAWKTIVWFFENIESILFALTAVVGSLVYCLETINALFIPTDDKTSATEKVFIPKIVSALKKFAALVTLITSHLPAWLKKKPKPIKVETVEEHKKP